MIDLTGVRSEAMLGQQRQEGIDAQAFVAYGENSPFSGHFSKLDSNRATPASLIRQRQVSTEG